MALGSVQALEEALASFRAAGRALFSLGLVNGTEGNLSIYDGTTLLITRTGASLGSLDDQDFVTLPVDGGAERDLAEASSDLEVHRHTYRANGRGAIVHAHPQGTVPEGGGLPGAHGVYVYGPSLQWAVEEAVRQARSVADVTGTEPEEIPPAEPDAAWSGRAVEWRGRSLWIVDQRRLPGELVYIDAADTGQVADAIRSMAVRGAPLLGIVAGYGMALAALGSRSAGAKGVLGDLERTGQMLRESRPTAANIGWAVDRVLRAAERSVERGDPPEAVRLAAVEEASMIATEDEASCKAIGRFGAALLPEGANVLTHCNTGAMATGGYGTAQGILVEAHLSGKQPHVWVGETRPLLQGARLTCWELQRLGIPVTLIADTAAGHVMARGQVDVVVVGADRVAANGDVANKVGTYQLAVLAHRHRIPFYVAAPLSTVDQNTARGDEIVIEERDPKEITAPLGVAFAPEGTPAANPAFDVTPAQLITAIVTDRGVARRPLGPALRRLARSQGPGPADSLAFGEAKR